MKRIKPSLNLICNPSHVHEEGAYHEPVDRTNFSYHNRFVELNSWEVVGIYSYPTAAKFNRVTKTAHIVAKKRKIIEKNRILRGFVTGYSKSIFATREEPAESNHLNNGAKDRTHSHDVL